MTFVDVLCSAMHATGVRCGAQVEATTAQGRWRDIRATRVPSLLLRHSRHGWVDRCASGDRGASFRQMLRLRLQRLCGTERVRVGRLCHRCR